MLDLNTRDLIFYKRGHDTQALVCSIDENNRQKNEINYMND